MQPLPLTTVCLPRPRCLFAFCSGPPRQAAAPHQLKVLLLPLWQLLTPMSRPQQTQHPPRVWPHPAPQQQQGGCHHHKAASVPSRYLWQGLDDVAHRMCDTNGKGCRLPIAAVRNHTVHDVVVDGSRLVIQLQLKKILGKCTPCTAETLPTW